MRVDKIKGKNELHVHLSPSDMRDLNNGYPIHDKIGVHGRNWRIVVHGYHVFEPSKKWFIGRAVDKLLCRD